MEPREYLQESFRKINKESPPSSHGKKEAGRIYTQNSYQSPEKSYYNFDEETDLINHMPPDISYSKASQIKKSQRTFASKAEPRHFKTIPKSRNLSPELVFSDEEESVRVGEEHAGTVRRRIGGLSPTKGANQSLAKRNWAMRENFLQQLLVDLKNKSSRVQGDEDK